MRAVTQEIAPAGLWHPDGARLAWLPPGAAVRIKSPPRTQRRHDVQHPPAPARGAVLQLHHLRDGAQDLECTRCKPYNLKPQSHGRSGSDALLQLQRWGAGDLWCQTSALRSDRSADQAIGIIDRRANQIDRLTGTSQSTVSDPLRLSDPKAMGTGLKLPHTREVAQDGL
jgi:hypothetical protein